MLCILAKSAVVDGDWTVERQILVFLRMETGLRSSSPK